MQKTAYEMRISDWSSDVCSSDLVTPSARSSTSSAPATASRSTARSAASTSQVPKDRRDAAFGDGQTHFAGGGTHLVRPLAHRNGAPAIGRAPGREREGPHG